MSWAWPLLNSIIRKILFSTASACSLAVSACHPGVDSRCMDWASAWGNHVLGMAAIAQHNHETLADDSVYMQLGCFSVTSRCRLALHQLSVYLGKPCLGHGCCLTASSGKSCLRQRLHAVWRFQRDIPVSTRVAWIERLLGETMPWAWPLLGNIIMKLSLMTASTCSLAVSA